MNVKLSQYLFNSLATLSCPSLKIPVFISAINSAVPFPIEMEICVFADNEYCRWHF